MRSMTLVAAAALTLVAGTAGQAAERRSPNIVVILADDLGYGDVGCYGATRVKTPNIDRLAAGGLRFTDAHSPAATCTPSRYSLLTGEYAWRRPGTAILPGDATLIIEPGRPTLPAILKQAGYATAAVGKWHLGLGRTAVDWNGEIVPGPLEIGFDEAFILPATGDRVPCVYVRDHRVVGLDSKDPIRVSYTQPIGDEPTGAAHPELLKVKVSVDHDHEGTIVNGLGRIGYMSGGKAARWVDEEMADVLTREAVAFVERHRDQPFFLYFATHDIHVPRVPHRRFAGTSSCGLRGDVIQQLDAGVGELLAALDRLGLTDDTLVLFTSDNGPVVDDGYADGAVENLGDHAPSGPWKGGKYTSYEGGTRVPWVVRWPGKVRPGVSQALVSQVDLLASFAALAGRGALPANAGPDSFNVLPALVGRSLKGRDHLVEQGGLLDFHNGRWEWVATDSSEQGGPLALRKGRWKWITTGRGTGKLYDLERDPAETKDIASQRTAVARELAGFLKQLRDQGRSRR